MFEKIFKVMKKMADEGNEFFQYAVYQYEESDEETKENMEQWLCDSFEGITMTEENIEATLFCMQYE